MQEFSKNMYLAEKERLDHKLQGAQEIYNEYKEKVKRRILSEGDISVATRERRNLADYLDRVGEIAFEHKRNIIDILNIMRRRAIEVGQHVVYLHIHDIPSDRLSLGEVPVSSFG
jgi:hypothetical protein